MHRISDLDTAARHDLFEQLTREHAALKARGIRLNIARGKPAKEQLDFSNTPRPKCTRGQRMPGLNCGYSALAGYRLNAYWH